MKFTLNRTKLVGGTSGHTIEFVKGIPVHVPKEMHAAVLAIGAVPEEEIIEPVKVGKVIPTEQSDRDAELRPILEQILAKNDVDEFTANGAPKLDVVSNAVGFKASKKEVDILWAKIKLGNEED